MTVGLPRDKASLDSKAGSLVTGLFDYLRQCAAYHAMLSDTDIFANDAELAAMDYEEADIEHLRGTFAAFNKLNEIAHNRASQPVADDFFFHAKHLTGLVF